jgi:hypothetical protein
MVLVAMGLYNAAHMVFRNSVDLGRFARCFATIIETANLVTPARVRMNTRRFLSGRWWCFRHLKIGG